MQKTRIIFKDFTLEEKYMIENLVSTTEKSFLYEDFDNNMICTMTGMKKYIKEAFPHLHIKDELNVHWPYETFPSYEIPTAQPRNRLQQDYINCVFNNTKDNNVGGILSPGKPVP